MDEKYPDLVELMRSYDVIGFKVDGYDKTVYYVGQISQLPREVALPLSEWNEAQKLIGKEVWKSHNNEFIMFHPTRSYYLPLDTRLLDRFVVQSVALDNQFAGRSRDGHTAEILEE